MKFIFLDYRTKLENKKERTVKMTYLKKDSI